MNTVSILLSAIGVLLLCAGLASGSWLASLDKPGAISRVTTLDGLRGALALGIVLHHGLIYRRYVATGEWAGLPGLTNLIGSSAVALFFMITGYLFWSQVIRRLGRPSWFQLYIGRVFRIGPVFLVATLAALIATFAIVPERTVSSDQLIREITPYFLLGAISLPSVNGFHTPHLLASVVWTLQYEWMFYAALPLLALAARRGWQHAALPLALVVGAAGILPHVSGTIEFKIPAIATMLFGLGMLSASLHAHRVRFGAGTAGSIACLALAAAVMTGFTTAYTRPAMLLLGMMFYLIASGCTVFGSLTTRPLRRLGEISYGVYMLHGLVLAAVFGLAPVKALSLADPFLHEALVIAVAPVVVVLAACVHVWIERPGILLGQHVTQWAASRTLTADGALSPDGLEPR